MHPYELQTVFFLLLFGGFSLKRKLFEHTQSLFLARPSIGMDVYCQQTILRLQSGPVLPKSTSVHV